MAVIGRIRKSKKAWASSARGRPQSPVLNKIRDRVAELQPGQEFEVDSTALCLAASTIAGAAGRSLTGIGVHIKSNDNVVLYKV